MSMVMQVYREECNGCGICVETCPNDAIILLDGKAEINSQKCTMCTSCAEACPNEAIRAVDLTQGIVPASPSVIKMANPETIPSPPTRTLAPWMSATLSFLGREVAPRLLDVLLGRIEQREANPLSQSVQPKRTWLHQSVMSAYPRPCKQTKRHRQRRGRSWNC